MLLLHWEYAKLCLRPPKSCSYTRSRQKIFIRKILYVLQDSNISIYGLGDIGYAKI
jgi:hypothetical protein